MSSTTASKSNVMGGALWAILAAICFSTNDVLVKFLSGDYPLYQVIFFRSFFGLLTLLAVLVPLTGGLKVLKTRRLGIHLIRGFCVVVANLTFFLGLAAMELAEAVAIFFVSPLLITLFSVIFLRELVGPNRWAAVFFGLIGVLVVLRPGTEAFQFAALLPVVAATFYAFIHIITRIIGSTENPTAMAFYIQLSFLVIAGGASLLTYDGRFEVYDHPSLEFLFRAWTWPGARDVVLLIMLGIASTFGGFAISSAYSRSEAAFVAPFEYLAMPISVFWGLVIFAEFPDTWTWAGITLILTSGLVLIWREAVTRRKQTLDAPKRI